MQITEPAEARPELGKIEDGIASPGLLSVCRDPMPSETSIDSLETEKITRPQWREGLDQESLVQWSAGRSVGKEDTLSWKDAALLQTCDRNGTSMRVCARTKCPYPQVNLLIQNLLENIYSNTWKNNGMTASW